MNQLTLKQIPRLSPSRFPGSNSISFNRVPHFCHFDFKSGYWLMEKGWKIIGWMPSNSTYHTSIGRKDQIVLLAHHPKWGELWQHSPIYPKERVESIIIGQLL